MRHARGEALDALENDVLSELRSHPGLKEKNRGVFYLNSKAFVHFHEDPAGLFADLRVGGDFRRLPLNSDHERSQFLAAAAIALGGPR